MKNVLKYVLLCASLLSLHSAYSAQSSGNEKIKPTQEFAKNYEKFVKAMQTGFAHQLIADASSLAEIRSIHSEFKVLIEKDDSLLKIFAIKYEELSSDHLEKDCGYDEKKFEDVFKQSLWYLNREKTHFLNQNVWPQVNRSMFQKVFNSTRVQEMIKEKLNQSKRNP